jgi:threonine dehydrogenase-like Zn-dependent dehydrogenase
MKAIVVSPRVAKSTHMRDVPDPELRRGQVAVRTIRVGLCATDAEIDHGLYGEAPDGSDVLILGHENFGVVEAVGKGVAGWKPGDYVVARVRRPCGVCAPCKAGDNDMCSSGLYTERGIMRRHGFMSEYYVESPQYLHRIPRAIRDVAVLLEPTSVVEKGIDHAFRLQSRMHGWKPRLGLALGAGPIGLLAAAVMRLRGLRTVVIGREDAADRRARIARRLGAEYLSVANRTLDDVVREIGAPDLVMEATGSAQVVFDATTILNRNGVLCLLSVTGGDRLHPEPIDRINQRLVLGNQAVFGSVNANARHFAQGVTDLAAIERKRPGALGGLLTTPIPWDACRTWFDERGGAIKATLEISSP